MSSSINTPLVDPLALSQHVNDLELRMRKLESFHHWIATQIYPDIKARIERIERAIAEEVWKQDELTHGHHDPNRNPVRMPDYKVTSQGAPIHETNVEHLLKREPGEQDK